jgi:hypothetical protein
MAVSVIFSVKEKITKKAKIKIAVRVHCIIVLIRGKDAGLLPNLQQGA